ncbi:putative amidoligase enzyme [Roseinatronobacter thiooxidans]|uniref:Putative amidoligase enzyme n=1 Tax=Roseinatronobacter thiooxidans TaxID=121821 RepID=A0A2W7QE02_9RHOB|nr:amidoligase family protein [Roseinatronobacter thiooxidans]PZX45636.1 putative amidoligase enzyme [Roseinatronobacter thiooxidans]
MIHDNIPTDPFLPLPNHAGQSSAGRKTGIEIEFAGLSVEGAAQVVQQLWGGRLVPLNDRDLKLSGGQFGDVKVELDISLQKKWAEDLAAQALGGLVPVEIVTAPLAHGDLPQADRLVAALRKAGALGTRARLAYGFGLHLNPELPGPDGAGLVEVARAYALLEPWLRQSDPIDPARRVLPFVDPWPLDLTDVLAPAKGWSVEHFARIYATHAPSRNYGLDMLPALQYLCPDALGAVPDAHLKGARPTFHYRLPEARLDEAGWSIAYEWNRWCLIEAVAANAAILQELARRWQDHRAALLPRGRDWAAQVESVLAAADLPVHHGGQTGATG